MNINDVLIRVLKKNDEISEQILHRNEEEDEAKHALEIKAREERDREMAEKFQHEEWEISKLEQLKQVEIDRQTEDEQWQSDELKNIEKETKNRKSELERLRAAARELEKARELERAEEEEIAQLKRTLAVKEDNRGSSLTRGRSSEKRSFRQEVKVYEEEDDDEEWAGNLVVEEASSEEELEPPVRRGSNAKRSASGSPRTRLVPVDSTDDEDDDFQSLGGSRLRTSRRKLSSASLPEEDFKSSRSAKARMARRNLSSASLHAHDSEDDYSDEEDDYNARLRPKKRSPKPKRKPQTSSGNLVDDLTAQFQGFMPMGMGSPHRSGSNSRSGSPIYIGGNPFIAGPYGYGMPGTVVNSGVGNIVNSSISNVGNDNSVRKVYRKCFFFHAIFFGSCNLQL